MQDAGGLSRTQLIRRNPTDLWVQDFFPVVPCHTLLRFIGSSLNPESSCNLGHIIDACVISLLAGSSRLHNWTHFKSP